VLWRANGVSTSHSNALILPRIMAVYLEKLIEGVQEMVIWKQKS